MSKRMLATLGLALWALGATGCAHKKKQVRTAQPDAPFKIGRDDVLDIAVWRDPDLSRTLPVRPDGFISLPLVGDVKAEGKTPNELADEIKQKLTPYVQAPKVTVIVREVHSAQIFVTGEVARPGAYPLRGRASLLQVIAMAGGFSEFASEDSMVVVRGGTDGGTIPVRYSDLVRDDEDRTEFFLEPGDTVVVP